MQKIKTCRGLALTTKEATRICELLTYLANSYDPNGRGQHNRKCKSAAALAERIKKAK